MLMSLALPMWMHAGITEPVADGAPVTVTVKVNADPGSFQPVEAIAFNADGSYSEYMDEDEPKEAFTFNLPQGEFDFAVFFSKIAPDYMFGSTGDVIVILEQIMVDNDMTLTADPLTATHHIRFTSLNPDGTQSKVKTICYKAEGSDEYDVVDEGNVKTMAYDTRLRNIDYGFTCYWKMMLDPGSIVETGPSLKINAERLTDIHVTPLSNRYVAGQNRAIWGNDAVYLTEFRCKGSFDGEIKNDESRYYSINSALKPSASSNSEPSDQPYILQWEPMWGNMMEDSKITMRSATPETHTIMYCPNHDDYLPGNPAVNISFAYLDKITRFEYGWNETLVQERPLCLVSETHNPYVILPQGAYVYETPGGETKANFPGNEAYMFEWDKVFKGDCVPWLKFMIHGFYDEKADLIHKETTIYFSGLNAESRSDSYNIKATLNGIEADDDFDSWLSQLPPGGNLHISFASEEVEISGTKGQNSTEIRINRDTGDEYAPTLTMLQMKNSQGLLTNRFSTPHDGLVSFSCGDFNFTTDPGNPYKTWFEYADTEVKLSYSANGRDEWHEMSIDEISELMYLPGFGKHYQADLSAITEPGPNGWYDLRFLFTDLSGNTMEQTISPAFCIESMSSAIPVITPQEITFRKEHRTLHILGASAPLVEIYTMSGLRIFAGHTNTVKLEQFPCATYIVRCTTTDGDIVTNKLFVSE